MSKSLWTPAHPVFKGVKKEFASCLQEPLVLWKGFTLDVGTLLQKFDCIRTRTLVRPATDIRDRANSSERY